jgi:hypothetical protein
MKKILYISALAVMSAATLSSCDDFLDADNKSAGGQTADSYFSTAEGLSSFRVNAFYSLKKLATLTDIYEDGTDLYVPARSKTATVFQNYTLTPETSDVKSFYIYCYQVINNANGLLNYGGDTYASDAKFLRAYGYYLLTQNFGDVPYSDIYINNSNRDYPRESKSVIYEKCIADLEEVYNDASLADQAQDGSVSHRAAAALLAKFYLAAAWDEQTTLTDALTGTYTVASDHSYFAKAAEWAEKAIAGINLTQDFETKWYPTNELSNPETFFSVQYDRASYPGDVTSGGHGLQNTFSNYYGSVATTGMKYGLSYKVPSTKSLYLWDKGDERYAGTFMLTFYNYDGSNWGTSGYYAYYNSAAKRDQLPIAFYYAPAYTTQDEFEAFLKENQSRFAQGSYINTPQAFLMQDPVITYSFNADGSIASTTSKAYDQNNHLTIVNGTQAVKKFDDPETIQEDGNSANDYRDIVLLHASDLYLVAAEAYLLNGEESKALAKVNAVRERAKAGSLSSFSAYEPLYATSRDIRPLDLILDERARELYAENQRWMDLRRTRQLVRYNVDFNYIIDNVSAMSSTTGDVKWYRPIPADEISSNTALTSADQNPGY